MSEQPKLTQEQIDTLKFIHMILNHVTAHASITLDLDKVPSNKTELLLDALEYLRRKDLIGYTKEVRDEKTQVLLLNKIGVMCTIPDDFMASKKPTQTGVEDADTGI